MSTTRTATATETVELEAETVRLLEDLVQRTGETKQALLRNALRNGMLDVDEYFSAEAIMERVRNGSERTYSVAEVRRDLGLDD